MFLFSGMPEAMTPPGLLSDPIQIKVKSDATKVLALQDTCYQNSPRHNTCNGCKQDFNLFECQARKPLLDKQEAENRQCLKCDTTFGPGGVLEKHVENVLCERIALIPKEPVIEASLQLDKHDCDQCKLSFGSQEVLQIHVANVHSEVSAEPNLTATNGAESKCEHCSELEKFKRNILLEIKYISYKLQNLKCEPRGNCKHKLSCKECDENLCVLLNHFTKTHIFENLQPKEETNVEQDLEDQHILDDHENEELSDNDNLSDPDYVPDDNDDKENPEPMVLANSDQNVQEGPKQNLERDKTNKTCLPSSNCMATVKKKTKVKKHYVRKRIPCNLCGKLYRDNHALKCHMKGFHNDGKPIRCGVCDMDFKSTKERIIHNKANHKKEKALCKCPQCDKVIVGLYHLNLHIRRVHMKIRNHKCEICEKMFCNAQYLAIHKKAVHGDNERPFQCKVPNCGKSFKTEFSLHSHTIYIHEKVKKYQCDKCEKSFVRLTSLQNHMAVIHDKTARHKCTQCDLAFVCRYSLTRHIEAVHENKRQHQCDKCGNSYNYATLLEKHMKAVHDDINDAKPSEPK